MNLNPLPTANAGTPQTLCELNPELKTSNLKTGMKLQLPNMEEATVPEKVLIEENKVVEKVNKVTTENVFSNVDIVHRVLPKETLYGISRETGVSIEEITRLNPSVANGLKIDQFLIIKKGTGETTLNKNEVVESQKDVELAKPLSSENLSKADLSKSNKLPHKKGISGKFL